MHYIMKRFLILTLAAILPLMVACDKNAKLPVVQRAFLALPDDAFASIASDIAAPDARKALVDTFSFSTGSNEDTRFFSLYYDTETPDELTVSCFQDPVFDYFQMHVYKLEGGDWLVLTDSAESVAESPMKSLSTKAWLFHAGKGTVEATEFAFDPYKNDDFYDPVVSWPYIKSGSDVKSVHFLMMDWGFYICPNITDEPGAQDAMNPMPIALKYIRDGKAFHRSGRGPALGFIDNLAAFNVTEQPKLPYDFEFPGCRMESLEEEGYNNIPIRHFDLYQGDERLVRFDPFSLPDEEGRFILMQVTAFSPRYTTSEGFGVGSLLKDIASAGKIYGMDAGDLIIQKTETDDGRPALSVSFQGYEAETLFITDAASADAEGAKVVEVLIRPIAQG